MHRNFNKLSLDHGIMGRTLAFIHSEWNGGWFDVTSVLTRSIWLLYWIFTIEDQGSKRETGKNINVRDDGGLKQSGSSGNGKKSHQIMGTFWKQNNRTWWELWYVRDRSQGWLQNFVVLATDRRSTIYWSGEDWKRSDEEISRAQFWTWILH